MTVGQLLSVLAHRIMGSPDGRYTVARNADQLVVRFELTDPVTAEAALDILTGAGVYLDSVEAVAVTDGRRRAFIGKAADTGDRLTVVLTFTESE